jgi:ABC-type sulfate transport system permease component
MHGSVVILVLLVCALALALVIEYTYSTDFKRRVPKRRSRMYTRGVFFSLLLCTALLLICVPWVMLTADLPRPWDLPPPPPEPRVWVTRLPARLEC